MPKNPAERQREYRDKMYKAGLKPYFLWFKRNEKKDVTMTQREFVRTLTKLTAGWSKERQSQLYNLLVRVVKGKKEADKHKKT